MRATYIMGYSRSGSTLFESVLASHEGLNALGELKYVAERAISKGERCSCGQFSPECRFWGPVLREMSHWDASEIAKITNRLESTRWFFVNVFLVRLGFLRRDLRKYLEFNSELFSLLSEAGGYIDSSKMPARVYFLNRLDTEWRYERVIWIVRDPRGVAWSCMKDIDRPEARQTQDRKMPRFGFYTALVKWGLNSVVSNYVAQRVKNVHLIRYEDFVRDPMEVMDVKPNVSESEPLFHSVSGNPRRFQGGFNKVSADLEWQSRLGMQRKVLGYVMCLPLMLKFSYSLHGDTQ
ncbi:MAG: hypothetical protein GC186_19245 [Rhodobacteraceae bacterium]|nr:hypothetical protein [Paracoccaceae bacterium]